ncbi:PIN domain-containing protein, partial [Candidatus Sumerlaeota bacterium]|nr:PIN domain-containing protein [Candidatus Sumerlaeota bacterium]
MRKIRVYVDTSVFGGTQDEEFSEASLRFFERVSRGDFRILLSPETLRELSRAPEPVRVVWRQLSLESIEEVLINEEVAELARSYIRANVLGAASEADSLHVAAATFA